MVSARPNFYTPNEVSLHNTLKDIWVSYLGKVYDLTPLCEEYAGKKKVKKSMLAVGLRCSCFLGDLLLKPIIASAGKDISHWFDKKTGDVSN